MILQCGDLERALRTPELMPDLRAHAANCPDCAAELHLWNELSRVAPELHEEWETPFLWRRIETKLAAEKPTRRRAPLWRWAMAGAAVVAAGAMLLVHPWQPAAPPERALLTERALGEVRQAESAYAKSIARLSTLALQDLDRSPTPLAAAYREKLVMLDAAIAEAKANVDQNRYNTYLRTELASLYQEKEKTLEDWLRNANRN